MSERLETVLEWPSLPLFYFRVVSGCLFISASHTQSQKLITMQILENALEMNEVLRSDCLQDVH